MASSGSSPSHLVPCDDRRGYRFHSHSSLCSLLCISSPYCQCIAFAPHARMAPRCSRRVSKAKKKQVLDLLANLLQARIPSTRAGGLLEELSTRVVCGKNPGCLHQAQAAEIYKGWCVKLWGEYLREHGLDPESWKEPPSRLTRETWEAGLEVALDQVAQDQEEQQHHDSDADWGYDPDEEEDYDSYDNGSCSESEESVATPDTTISDFDQSPPDGDTLTPPRGLHTSGQSCRRPESPADSRPSSKGAINIYRDPKLPSVDPAPVGDGRALRRLDQNIPVPRRREPCPADPRKTTHQLESDMGPGLSDGKSPAISDDEALDTPEGTEDEESESEYVETESEDEETESEDEEWMSGDEEIASGGYYQNGNDDGRGEEQTQAGTDGDGLPRHDRASPEDDSAQDEAEEEEEEPPSVAVDIITGGVGFDDDDDDDDGDSSSDCTGSETEAEADGGDVEDDAAAAHATEVALLVTRATPPGFRLYPQDPTPLSQLENLLGLMTRTVTARRRRTGFIYAFARPSLPGFLKIGYVEDPRAGVPRRNPVDKRLSKWQHDCGHPITEVFRTRIVCAAVERIERLVHMTLKEHRRKEDPPCEPCGVRHNEWFEMEEHAAKEVVDAWALFAAQQPYDRFGRLVDFWSEKVDGERRRVGDGDTAKSWLKTMPEMVDFWSEKVDGERRRVGDGDTAKSWLKTTMPEMVEELRRGEFNNIIGPLGDMSLGAKEVRKKVRTW